MALSVLEVLDPTVICDCERFLCIFGQDGTFRKQINLSDIVTLLWLWAYSGMTVTRAAKAAGVCKLWFDKCRNVCRVSEMALPKMRGTRDEPLQVDESYFAGRRKYNRGRLAGGDRRPPGESTARAELEVEFAHWGAHEPPTGEEPSELAVRPNSQE